MLILADTHKGYMKPVKTAAIWCILDKGKRFLKQENLVSSLKEVPDLYFEVFSTAIRQLHNQEKEINRIYETI